MSATITTNGTTYKLHIGESIHFTFKTLRDAVAYAVGTGLHIVHAIEHN